MTSTEASSSTPERSSATGPQSVNAFDPADPRHGLAAAVGAADQAIGVAAEPGSELLNRSTPCPQMTVEALIEHIIFVARRVVTIGNGGHFTETPDRPAAPNWSDSFGQLAQQIEAAWADPAKLGSNYDVPWGTVPGAALMLSYTAEFATHTWDLTRAIGAEVEIDDAVLAQAAEAVRFIPADGRDDPSIPFGPVVEAPADASNLERIVTWVGRSLEWAPPAG